MTWLIIFAAVLIFSVGLILGATLAEWRLAKRVEEAEGEILARHGLCGDEITIPPKPRPEKLGPRMVC